MRQQVEKLEAQVRRLQAIGDLEKQEKLILIEDMNTMHQLQKEQIEQDRRHLQQMDETNEQLCQDLIHAEAELTLLRNTRRRESTTAVETDGDLAATEGPTVPTTTTSPRQSSMEIEAALAWEEKAALEALLRDTQRELGASVWLDASAARLSVHVSCCSADMCATT
jgi:predicted RNase H-like nuclease (RuvC/YqgF family)